MTPIDWKPLHGETVGDHSVCKVTTRWWHLLIGNTQRQIPQVDYSNFCHHLLVTPIDWKPREGVGDVVAINKSPLAGAPIDWKLPEIIPYGLNKSAVTTRW